MSDRKSLLPPLRERTDLLAAAREMVAGARTIILEALQTGFSHRFKADASFVTDVDLAVEAHIRSEIERRFPHHGIIGEENEDVREEASFTWVIDPIDGTHSFRHRVPLFGTLLALRYEGRPIIGVIDHAALGLSFSGGIGLGVHCNSTPVQMGTLAPGERIEHEIIATGAPFQFVDAGKKTLFTDLLDHHPNVRTYCDCFGHTLALQGSVGAMVDVGLKVWDLAATEPLVAEAGGTYVCFDQRRGEDGVMRYDIVLGKPAVVEWLLPLLAPAASRSR